MTASLQTSPRVVAQTYFDLWTSHRFEDAAALLSETVAIETPINIYPMKADFVAALRGFGALVTETSDLVTLGDESDAVQVYDMEVTGLGIIRMAEHFVVQDGLITKLRQIHDTVVLRDAGFDGQSR